MAHDDLTMDNGNMPAAPDGKPPRRGWPLSSLLLFGLSAVLAILALLLWTGTIRLPAKAPDVTPGAIRTVDVVSALKDAGLSAALDQKLFVPRGAFDGPGQGIVVNGAPMLLFVFKDRASAEAAFESAQVDTVLPAKLPGGIEVNPADVTLAQGSNVIAALVGGDEQTRSTVKTTIEGLP